MTNIFVTIFIGCVLFSGSTFAQAPEDHAVTSSSKMDLSQLKLKERPVNPKADECQFCHTKKNRPFHKVGAAPKKMHEEITPMHGKRIISCNSCHDINNQNYLRSSKEQPAKFGASSPVCARCHMEKYRDWTKGLHGKRLGGWQQPKIQFHCIDCHNPHAVSFPKGQTVAQPPLSPYVILKEQESKGEH